MRGFECESVGRVFNAISLLYLSFFEFLLYFIDPVLMRTDLSRSSISITAGGCTRVRCESRKMEKDDEVLL